MVADGLPQPRACPPKKCGCFPFSPEVEKQGSPVVRSTALGLAQHLLLPCLLDVRPPHKQGDQGRETCPGPGSSGGGTGLGSNPCFPTHHLCLLGQGAVSLSLGILLCKRGQ